MVASWFLVMIRLLCKLSLKQGICIDQLIQRIKLHGYTHSLDQHVIANSNRRIVYWTRYCLYSFFYSFDFRPLISQLHTRNDQRSTERTFHSDQTIRNRTFGELSSVRETCSNLTTVRVNRTTIVYRCDDSRANRRLAKRAGELAWEIKT